MRDAITKIPDDVMREIAIVTDKLGTAANGHPCSTVAVAASRFLGSVFAPLSEHEANAMIDAIAAQAKRVASSMRIFEGIKPEGSA